MAFLTDTAGWSQASARARRQRALGLSASCRISVINNITGLLALEQEWRSLEARNQALTTVFTSFDWCCAWSETYCTDKGQDAELLIVTGRQDGQLVFLFPLMRRRQMGLRVLTWLTDPAGQYGDILCASGQNASTWIAASFKELRRSRTADLVYLRHVRADAILAMQASGLMISARVPEEAPYLDLTAFSSEAEYDARYTSVQRKRRKKIRKAIEQLGTISFSALQPGADADAAMATALTEKCAWLAERGRINRVLACPLHQTFLATLSRRKGDVSVIVSEMKAGEKPVSWEIGFRHGKRHYGYVTSHVNALTDLSPGRLHMDQSQRQCLADGMEVFDLMVPNDAHKESWSSAKVLTNDLFLPFNVAGWIAGHVYLKTLRPRLRDLYYWMEPKALRWLNPRAQRKTAKGAAAEE